MPKKPRKNPPQHATVSSILNQALALHRGGNLQAAESKYREVLSRDPRQFDALHLLGVVKAQTGDYPAAAALIGSAVSVRPDHPEAHNNLGNVLAAQQRFQEAADHYDKALRLKPDYADALNNLGNALRSLKRPKEALACYSRALALAPGHAEANNNMGEILKEQGRLDEASDFIGKAIALRPAYAAAHNNMGILLQARNRPAEAVESYQRALALDPGFADAHNNLGFALQSLNRVTEALDHYRLARRLAPQSADILWNESLALLCLGRYQEGWEKYESRWKQKLSAGAPDFGKPLWLGLEPLRGKNVLICGEQGAGDSLQCMRYLPRLVGLGAERIYLSVNPGLAELATRSFPFLSVLREPGLPAAFDCYCPLMSLPLALKTFSEASIPRNIPYIRASGEKREKWRNRLRRDGRPLVGVAWRGDPRHINDHNRSISSATMKRLLETETANFVILQVPLAAEDREVLRNLDNCIIASDGLTDFDETAAVVAELDLVVTVDTSIAHLSGALGRPTWVLLPFAAEWRWMLDRPDSPWYPTARLYRQPAIGDWHTVLDAVKRALRELASGFPGGLPG